MAEWPKPYPREARPMTPEEQAEWKMRFVDGEPVVPADLARELYEALKRRVEDQREYLAREAFIGYDVDEPWPDEELLARYEEEVGNA